MLIFRCKIKTRRTEHFSFDEVMVRESSQRDELCVFSENMSIMT